MIFYHYVGSLKHRLAPVATYWDEASPWQLSSPSLVSLPGPQAPPTGQRCDVSSDIKVQKDSHDLGSSG